MKILMHAGIVLLLAMPIFAASQFQGPDPWNQDSSNFKALVHEVPIDTQNIRAKSENRAPEIIKKMERFTENGDLVEILPKRTIDETGKQRTIYPVQPGWIVRWKISCPADGTWSMKYSYAWNKIGRAHV